MSTPREEAIQQTPSPLPPVPEEDVLTEDQWRLLAAIAETFVPSIAPVHQTLSSLTHALSPASYKSAVRTIGDSTGNAVHDDALVAEYLDETPTATTAFKESMQRLLAFQLSGDQRRGLLFVLNALNSRAALLLTGHSTPLYDLDVPTREKVLLSWSTARLPLFRQLFRDLAGMSIVYWVRTSPSLGRLLSYPRTPINHNFGEGYPFAFLQFPSPPLEASTAEPEIVETDVVVVGSGCCGAVAASVLSSAGLDVIVADKSYYWPPQHLPMDEASAAAHLFTNGGLVRSEDGSMSMLSGSCWGGGGTVNWSASLQLQGFVRSEWAQSPHNLPYFTSARFQADMDAVCERMGVGTASVTHNYSNAKLLEGARRLGMNAKTVPQNTGGKAHNCGYCTLGCGSCGKKGPTETFLPDAAKAGANFIEGFTCSRVLFSSASSSGGDPVATGVTGFWTCRDSSSGLSGSDRYTRPVTIKARKAVIVTAGALSTPLILQRSNLQNPHIGRHLHLHPVSFLGAVFDEEVRPWEGGILTAVVNDLENLDRRGHGVKLEATTMIPGLFLPIFGVVSGGWKGGLEWKAFCAKMGRMAGYISLARDEGEGRVYGDKEGKIRVAYKVNKRDQRRIGQGLESLAKIMHVSGARELFAPVQGMETFVRKGDTGPEEGVNDDELRKWIETLRQKTTPALPALSSFASAHQMGSARMGATPQTSAVSPSGRVWGTKGLYVMDTSVFPSASGVNPMITGMGIAYGLAKELAKELASRAVAPERARL